MSRTVFELSPKQEKVLNVLDKAGEPLTIKQLGSRAFPGVRPALKAQSWARNSLRGLVAHALVKKVDRGTYAKKPAKA